MVYILIDVGIVLITFTAPAVRFTRHYKNSHFGGVDNKISFFYTIRIANLSNYSLCMISSTYTRKDAGNMVLKLGST